MCTTVTFPFLALVLALTGCTGERRADSSQPRAPSHSLSATEKARCKQVAWDAASSPVMWERCKVKRVSTEPIKLDERGTDYWIWDQTNFASVEVVIPSGGRVGWHSCFIGVTVARGTYEVLSMRESFGHDDLAAQPERGANGRQPLR